MIPKAAVMIFLSLLAAAMPTSAGNIATYCPSAQLLEVGEFHGEEVSAETGNEYLGLHISDNDESMLLNYKVTVERVHDPLGDGPDEMTGAKVSVDLPLEPLFLVNAGEILSAGPAQTIFAGSFDQPLREQEPVNLKLSDVSYQLKVVPGEGETCGQHALPRNAKLVFSSGETNQVLYGLEECGNDATWFLIWAGDIDRDGKLDLYLNVTQHYNVSERKLFLSSAAPEGDLVQEIADFVTSGC